MFENRKVKELKNVRDLQKQSINSESDDYTVGLYNGLELSLAIMEGREPVFETSDKKSVIVEQGEEKPGRTIASGIRRRKQEV